MRTTPAGTAVSTRLLDIDAGSDAQSLSGPPLPNPPYRRPGSRTGPYGEPQRPFRRRLYRELSPVGQMHARMYARRPRPGQFVRPDVDELVPYGYRPVLDRDAQMALFEQLPSTALLRRDSYGTRSAVWRALLDHCDPATGLAVVGQEQIARRASEHAGRYIARATAGNHLRALAEERALAVERGASKEVLYSDRDRASVYVVIEPSRSHTRGAEPLTAEQSAALTRLDAQLDNLALAHAPVDELGHHPERSAHPRVVINTHPRNASHFPSSLPITTTYATSPTTILGRPRGRAGLSRSEHPELYNPRTDSERARAIAWLSAVMGWTSRRRFAALIDNELPKIVSRKFAGGWSPAAVVHALRVRPDGTDWPGPLPIPSQRDAVDQLRIRNLAAVLTYRLAAWDDSLGQPLEPPVASERPARGRPRTPPAPPAKPAPARRSARVEAELAAFRARNSQQRAQRLATDTERAVHRDLGWSARADDTGPTSATYLRAGIARSDRGYSRRIQSPQTTDIWRRRDIS